MSEIDLLRKEIEDKLTKFKAEADKLEREFSGTFLELAKRGYKIDQEQIPTFTRKFWHTYPTKNQGEWEVAVPVFMPFNVGIFDRQDGGYNIFIVNKYTKWLGGEIPHFIAAEINLPPAWNLKFDGKELRFDEDKMEKVEAKFGSHLSLVEKDRAVVKQGHEFDLIAEIIESGSLPFVPKPVKQVDLRESKFTTVWDEVEEKHIPLELFDGKYSFQGDAWNQFQKHGAVGVYWSMSFGKTVFGTYALSRLKGPKCVVVPTILLKEQWTEFFKNNCPELLEEVEVVTYAGLSRRDWQELTKKNFTLIVFDECHFLPADSFSKLATLHAEYRIGLSASPFREDHRENHIMALTGFPIGCDWRAIMKVLGKEYHTVNVHVVRDFESKYALLKQLYNLERRTLVFVNRIEVGERAAGLLDIPFIHGATKNRLSAVRESQSFVASRVLEHGISIKDLEHIIEIDFMFGSKREELQRTGRLMHSIAQGKIHDIVMTKDELENYGKRLRGIYERGFRYKLIPHMSNLRTVEQVQKKPKSGGNYGKVLRRIYDEGFFKRPRTSGQVMEELSRNAVHNVDALQRHVYSALLGMVSAKKLYKTRTEEGNVFEQR